MEDRKPNEDHGIEAQTLLDFYTDLIEHSKNLLKYYLSEDIVLDWFGQTVKGQKDVAAFIKNKVNPMRHLLNEARPTNKIGFRDTHVVKTLRPSRRILRSTFLSPPRPTLMNTPIKLPQASTSARRQIGRPNLDGSDRSSPEERESPRKRLKVGSASVEPSTDIDVLESENDNCDVRVKYLTAEGNVEFHRPSLKKLQNETKWRRPCKIHIAYDSGKDIKDSTFYLIIYEGSAKCRRNLMRDFEAAEPEN